MLRLAVPLTIATGLSFSIAFADEAHEAQVDALFEALQLSEMTEIMREEGLSYGEDLAADLLPGGNSSDWQAAVSAIYDTDVMAQTLRSGMITGLADADVAAMTAFFTAEPGVTIIDLEVSARRALLDENIDQAAKENAAIAMADNTDLYQSVDAFVEANDLIDSNVVSALNSSYAFYLGLIDGGAMPPGMTPDVALDDVWSREAEIRANTTEWVYAFLLMAYQPLDDADLQAYIAFSETEAGASLNDALFQAFSAMFDEMSRGLGLAASRFMLTQEL